MSLNMLAYYAQRVAETKGIAHQTMLLNLRNYINQTPEVQLLKEIEEIYIYAQLRAMWEAGLNSTLQKAVLKQVQVLQARRD